LKLEYANTFSGDLHLQAIVGATFPAYNKFKPSPTSRIFSSVVLAYLSEELKGLGLSHSPALAGVKPAFSVLILIAILKNGNQANPLQKASLECLFQLINVDNLRLSV
jgi:hypothetical protein